MGDDQPFPGTSIFHATFSLVLQRSGRSGLSAMPIAPGPRNCGQFATGSAANGALVINGKSIRPTRDQFNKGRAAEEGKLSFTVGDLAGLDDPARKTGADNHTI